MAISVFFISANTIHPIAEEWRAIYNALATNLTGWST